MSAASLLAFGVHDALRTMVLACGAYLLLVYAAYGVMLAFSGLERVARLRRRRFDRLELVTDSPLTIPVSIVAPVYNEAPVVAAAVRSFLSVNYPEYEVIVVNDGSTDATLETLVAEFELRPIERFYRRILPSAPIRGIYRSRTHPRLVVVDKENGGKSDSLNCGLNLVRYRYVCGVDGDTLLLPTALLDGMRLALSDPARVIGVTGHIAIGGKPEQMLDERGRPSRVDRRPLLAFQHLDYVRSFFSNRLGWTRLNTMLCIVGAFQIWRRDVLEEVGGFSTEFTCEDIELTFRIHEKFRREGREYAILSLPDTVAVAEGPDRIRSLVAQRERWQRVIMETVFHYRRMLFNPRYGSVGMIGVPFYVLTEILAPLFEAVALLSLGAGVALGAFDVWQFVLVAGLIAAVNGLLTSAALLLEDQTSRAYRMADLAWLMVLGLLDLVLYRPLLFWARAKGAWRFLRRDRGWHKFVRNERAPQPG